MKIVRFWDGNQIAFGKLENDKVKIIEGDVFGGYKIGNKEYEVQQIQILAPCDPTKVVCIGLNYFDHANELSMPVPKTPVVFLKPPSSITGPNTNVFYPPGCTRLDYEAELAVVIGQITRYIEPHQASDRILGFTCSNDITARNLQPKDGQWTLAKSFDTFCPIGPFIETELEPNNLEIKLFLNGEQKQSSNTSEMIFNIEHLISYISKHMTLFPGDVVITGTPAGVGPMNVGDVVEVEIERLGKLTNTVVSM